MGKWLRLSVLLSSLGVFTSTKTVTTSIGNCKLALPLALVSGQRWEAGRAFDGTVGILDFDSEQGMGEVLIHRSVSGDLRLDCRGAASLYRSLPIAELTAKLCLRGQSDASGVDVRYPDPTLRDTFDISRLDGKPAEEIIEWVGNRRELLLPLPRRFIYQYHMLHRGFGAVLIHGETNKIFVHKRSSQKKVFPSMLDMFIGGVSAYKESAMTTLVRELDEEVGVDLSEVEMPFIDRQGVDDSLPSSSPYHLSSGSQVVYLGDITVRTAMNHCLVDCFAVKLAPFLANSIQFRDGEIEWGQWMNLEELYALLENGGEANFVPDGMQVQ